MKRGCAKAGVATAAGALLLLALAAAWPAHAARIPVPAGAGALQTALARARPGDILELLPGVHAGPVRIDKPLALIGRAGAVVDGGGKASVITVSAPGVSIEGLTVRNSGTDLSKMEAGIYVDDAGDGARIIGNVLEHNLFGVYLQGPAHALVRGNRIVGRRDPHVNERGNGVQIWRSPGSSVVDNDFRYGRDGIFVTNSRENVFRGNRFRELRYAIHYMYTHDSEVSDNVSVGNHVGYALMFSDRLAVHGNVSVDARDRGFLFNYTNSSVIENNLILRTAGKCVFLYNSSKNVIRRNVFDRCGIGIHFTAGSERNRIYENAFIANRIQVKYVGTRYLDWSYDGRGNFWSDNAAFDLDGDGIADAPYRPNDVIDRVLWTYPLAKLLVSSPAVQMVRWAQSQFPALYPGGVVDSAPLMAPPPGMAALLRRWETAGSAS